MRKGTLHHTQAIKYSHENLCISDCNPDLLLSLISLGVVIFSQIVTIIEHFFNFFVFLLLFLKVSRKFSTFLVDNQLGWDQNHFCLSAKKVEKHARL